MLPYCFRRFATAQKLHGAFPTVGFGARRIGLGDDRRDSDRPDVAA